MRNQILISTLLLYQMNSMFYGAASFNQDICYFGDNFSQISSLYYMFQDSGCSNTNDPTSESGPWCAVTTCPESSAVNLGLSRENRFSHYQ